MKLVVVGIAAALAVVVGAAVIYLAAPFGWKPPEVAPLSTGQNFHAKRVLRQGNGYVLAGVAGTTTPDADDRCSGRFALVHLDEDGSPRRAVVASGPERDRVCASGVDTVFPDDGRGWVLSGSTVRRAEPGLIEWEPQTEREWYALRFTADGYPDQGFGDDGLVRGVRVAGGVGDSLVTAHLERVTGDGDVLDDLWPEQDVAVPTWSRIVVEGDLLVALETGLPLTFRAFALDDSDPSPQIRALTADRERPDRTVDLGRGNFSFEDTVLDAGRLYVVTTRGPGHVFAVDPRRARVVASFGRGGRVDLTRNDLVLSAGLAVDGRGRVVVAFTTYDRAHGFRLHVRRFSAEGAPDRAFARVVSEDPGLDLAVTELLVDDAGRIVLLDELEATVTRLMPAGRFDPSFGEDGVASFSGLAVCTLPPARDGAPCRGR